MILNLTGKIAPIACGLLCCCSMVYAQGNDTSEVMLLDTGWEFSQSGTEKWMPATVPGTVHQDLISHELLPNPFYGMNEEKIQWLVPYYSNMSGCARKSNNRDILFFGAMSRPENYLSAIWFIENVMPLLNDLDVRFVIVGSKPPEELKRFKSDRIVITGFVNDTLPYFESSMCLVAPLVLGAGIKVKILEAMSSGIPVLTNDIGIEGIEIEDNVHETGVQTL